MTIISPERSTPMRGATVYIRDDRIVSISRHPPSNTRRGSEVVEVIDGHGLYLTPGLIDSHVHVSGVPGLTREYEQKHPDIARAAREQVPRSFLYFGFTTLIDLISGPDQVAAWNAHSPHPDLYFCGGAPVMDGYPMNWSPKPERYQEFTYMLVEPDQGSAVPQGIDPALHTPKAVIARMKADGARCVKSFFHRVPGQDLPVPRLDTIRALVKEAHAAGMTLLLHATGPEAQAFALDAGTDIIAHGLWDWTGKREGPTDLTPAIKKVLDRVIETRTGLQPTLQVGYGFRDLFDPVYLADPRVEQVYPHDLIEWYRSAEGQWFHDQVEQWLLPKPLRESGDAAAKWEFAQSSYDKPLARNKSATRYFAEHKGRLLFGTDTPAVPTYANPPGLNGWREMHGLVEAGVTAAQVFRAATLTNAESLGLGKELGTISVGKRANLLLLRQDPSQSIEAYDEIVKVILRGKVLERSDLIANR